LPKQDLAKALIITLFLELMMRIGIKAPYSQKPLKASPYAHSVDAFSNPRQSGKVVGNLGNLVFHYATSKLIEYSSAEFVPFYYDENPSAINERVDVLIFPEANFINPHKESGRAALFMRGITKPCLLLGAGVQVETSWLREKRKFDLKQSTIEFLRRIQDNSNNILVRGEYAASILNYHGITNVMPLGCPSYTINPSPTLWQTVKKKASNPILNFAITEGLYANLRERNSLHANLEELLLATAIGMNGQYIAQTNSSAIDFSLGITDGKSRRNFHSLVQKHLGHLSMDIIIKRILQSFKSFDSVDRWIGDCRSLDFCTGSRFHGNMIPIQAEVPSLPIAHDARTIELLETMLIPHIEIEQAYRWNSPFDVLNSIQILREIDANELDGRRREIAGSYIHELSSLGLTPSQRLISIAACLP